MPNTEHLTPNSRILALTGAGISVASGIRPFRGEDGLYEGLNPYELATPEAFAARPLMVWNWYAMRIRAGRDAVPNAAHLALASMEARGMRVTLVTANVDSLHQQAGSTRVHRLHGNIFETRCIACGAVEPLDPFAWPEEFTPDTLPQCPCGALVRPNVVWFGERPNAGAFDAWESEASTVDLVLEIGSSGTVTYGLAEWAAAQGVPVLRINTDPAPYPGIECWAEKAEVALPQLLELVLE